MPEYGYDSRSSYWYLLKNEVLEIYKEIENYEPDPPPEFPHGDRPIDQTRYWYMLEAQSRTFGKCIR